MYLSKIQLSLCSIQIRCMQRRDFMPDFKQNQRIFLPAPLGQLRPSPILTDPQGCYTARPIEKAAFPIQEEEFNR